MLEIKRPLILGSSGVVGKALLDYYSDEEGVTPIQYDIQLDKSMDLTTGIEAVWEYVDV